MGSRQAKCPQAAIFDLDGTLVDTFEDIALATNAGLTALGYLQQSSSRIRSYVGEGVVKLARKALAHARRQNLQEVSPQDSAKLAALITERYRERPCYHSALYPNVESVLSALRSNSVQLAVLSNKPHDLTLLVLEEMGLSSFFGHIQGATSEWGCKPDPRGLLRILARLDVRPEKAIMVGDGEPDAEVARRVGMRFVGAAYGLLDTDRLKALGALAVLRSPQDLLFFMESLRNMQGKEVVFRA